LSATCCSWTIESQRCQKWIALREHETKPLGNRC
jgi:hypothetical protein